ncbi:hypothetical protein C7I87_32655 [Mesorhizobium sp. SARCC-RB16n]|uniref:glucoamylase family protein n=1 Tax=Mesorhizobium sp. SARCC-RB16n TaxID=2116687 RepID=UPI00122F0343|nr:glucoamylase family protein [Mesorhizobium sp. SARCC-RB16n]KAA3442059.1 hypothetical protein C7I87_32655 [Mesorhizobium sp. SARCC-RB16n]
MKAYPDQMPLGDGLLAALQRKSFAYFLYEVNEANGLVADRSRKGSPASIAAVGLALTAYAVGVARGFMTREQACARTLTTLRFFWKSTQGTGPDATGYKGFYYHFLDMETGRRVWHCELSTIDTALLIAGILTVGAYFRDDSEDETEIRTLSEALYERVDWNWARNGEATVTHGWTPEKGFIGYRWEGYDEALILYVLGIGSPTHCLPPESYRAWLSTYRWKKIYGHEFAFAGPRKATYVQREYASRNSMEFSGYHENSWGVTASDGPGWQTRRIGGVERRFYGYRARGVPFGPDDGTLSPWAVAASLPFAPEIVVPALRNFHNIKLHLDNPYGFKASFNPTLASDNGDPAGWVAPDHLGLNQGPIVLMVENHRSDFLWRLMRGCRHVVRGLRGADFRGGWLETVGE